MRCLVRSKERLLHCLGGEAKNQQIAACYGGGSANSKQIHRKRSTGGGHGLELVGEVSGVEQREVVALPW